MIISSPLDYREAARRKLPPFLFHYLDGGSYAETTLSRNISDLQDMSLNQRILRNVADVSLETKLFGKKFGLPIILGPVGLNGMYAKRGEVQSARAAKAASIAFTLSTVSVCSLEEVISSVGQPVWFQLYVLKDRGFMRNMLERAQALNVDTLVFTVDMPVPGARYRDKRSGMSGPFAAQRRILQAMAHPAWAFDVGLMGKPHDLGNISVYRGRSTGLEDYIGWLTANFDPAIDWSDLEWIRTMWKGQIIIKGILNANDAKDAVRFGADGIVVSNHGGRQLDGAMSTARALPEIAAAVGDSLTVMADSGVRSGLDVLRMLALGAKGVLLGRAYMYALAANGEAGITQMLDLMAKEMRVAMSLCGVRTIADIGQDLVIPATVTSINR
jgi:L-lactate dehydrogenase (cytochrome)